MRFAELLARNLDRRRGRSLVTICGVTIAVATVTSLLGSVASFERSLNQIYQSHRVDLTVQRAGVAIRLSGSMDQSLAERLAQLPRVGQVAGTLTDTTAAEDSRLLGLTVTGIAAGSFLLDDLTITAGRGLAADDHHSVILGTMLARRAGKQPGDTITIDGTAFQVVGVFQSGSLLENAAAMVLLPTLQELMDRSGQVSEFQIRLAPDTPDRAAAVEQLRTAIEQLKSPQGAALELVALPARQHVGSSLELQLIKGLAWATSIIALTIGAIGTLNTMLMSVFERTQEIGILRAVGWSRPQVLGMILGESLAICLIGALGGIMLSVMVNLALEYSPFTEGVIGGWLPWWSFAAGVLLALTVGTVGGLYPAWRAARVSPAESLRHE